MVVALNSKELVVAWHIITLKGHFIAMYFMACVAVLLLGAVGPAGWLSFQATLSVGKTMTDIAALAMSNLKVHIGRAFESPMRFAMRRFLYDLGPPESLRIRDLARVCEVITKTRFAEFEEHAHNPLLIASMPVKIRSIVDVCHRAYLNTETDHLNDICRFVLIFALWFVGVLVPVRELHNMLNKTRQLKAMWANVLVAVALLGFAYAFMRDYPKTADFFSTEWAMDNMPLC